MSLDLKVACDNCRTDLTYTHNSIGRRLALNNEEIPVDPSARTVTDVAIYPAIKQNAHFCGVPCLRAWLGKKYPAPAAADIEPTAPTRKEIVEALEPWVKIAARFEGIQDVHNLFICYARNGEAVDVALRARSLFNLAFLHARLVAPLPAPDPIMPPPPAPQAPGEAQSDGG